MSIFVSTGEVSGDQYAAGLVRGLRSLGYDEPIWGMGGALAHGVQVEWNNEALQIIGLSGILCGLPRLLKLRDQLVGVVMERRPQAVVLVDSPDFHIPLARKLRARGYGGPIVYLCPPTVWAWRQGRAQSLKRYCTLCLPLFDFEERHLSRLGVSACWEGHPMVDGVAQWGVKDVRPRERSVALLPGSRPREVRLLLPILEELGKQLRSQGCEAVLSLAPGLRSDCAELIRHNAAELPVFEGTGRELMARSRIVVGASGTAAVEAMVIDRFMVVLYRGSGLEWMVFSLLRRTPFVSIPNVLARRQVYPELIQGRCRADLALRWTMAYLENESYRQQVHATLAANRRRLGRPGVMVRWAKRILDVAVPS